MRFFALGAAALTLAGCQTFSASTQSKMQTACLIATSAVAIADAYLATRATLPASIMQARAGAEAAILSLCSNVSKITDPIAAIAQLEAAAVAVTSAVAQAKKQ